MLTNESVYGSDTWSFSPTDFSNAVGVAEQDFTGGEYDVTTFAPEALSLGEYGEGADVEVFGADLLTVIPLEELLLGAAVSF